MNYTQTFMLRLYLRNKKERLIRSIVPDFSTEDVSSIIDIENNGPKKFGIQMILNGTGNKMDVSTTADEMKKDGAQKKNWLTRNPVSDKEYMHYVLFIRDKMKESTTSDDSSPNREDSSPKYESVRKHFSKFSNERSEQIMVIT